MVAPGREGLNQLGNFLALYCNQSTQTHQPTDRAFADYPGGTAEARHLRAILHAAMVRQGFEINPKEWWHFDYKDGRLYSIGNLKFEDLGR
jgi:D-alanyl-D-alanine dipeptidase